MAMKFAPTLILILSIGVPLAHAQTPTLISKEAPTFRKPGMVKGAPAKPLLQQLPRLLARPALAISSASVTYVTCPEITASLCGYVPVPLDRKYPNGTQLQIYFEVYPNMGGGTAESAIMVNLGGPGPGTTQSRDYFQFLFAPNMDVHDLLLVDDRGTGMSGAIDCPELQHGTAPFVQSEVDCVAQLGQAASRYANGDIAQDMEAVRVALGYNLIDYLGASWGGVDATAYAVRYPEHTRSLVLDAPLSTPGLPELVRLHDRVHSDPRMVRLVCSRSVLCSRDQPEPEETFEELIEMIRENPIEGDTFDASGNPMHIRIDEDALLNFVVTYPQGEYINTGEILAAAVALKHGDKAPLLRLGAEGFFTLVGDSGDPTSNSAAAYYAIGCADTVEPFDWSVPTFARIDQYNDAVADKPPSYYAPFSGSAANDFLFSGNGRQCFWWQRPTPPSPTVPPNTTFPDTPTLVLDGDIDNRVPYEETNEVAELFPNSTNVIIPEAGHETIGWSQCALNLANQFIENLQAGDTSCANTPAAIFPAVGRFPLMVEDARPAQPDTSGANQIGIAERKTVSVAVATAIDALQRSLISFGSGVGLRGGTFTTAINGAVWTVTLTNCAFATDVIVNGTFVWGADNSIIGVLMISGPGTAGGTLHINGFFDIPGPVGNFSLTGMLGGKQVAVLVPNA
jgi:pimeloyl-ACP methyl ester carboxylesterase